MPRPRPRPRVRARARDTMRRGGGFLDLESSEEKRTSWRDSSSLIHVEISLEDPLLESIRCLGLWHLLDWWFHRGGTLGPMMMLHRRRRHARWTRDGCSLSPVSHIICEVEPFISISASCTARPRISECVDSKAQSSGERSGGIAGRWWTITIFKWALVHRGRRGAGRCSRLEDETCRLHHHHRRRRARSDSGSRRGRWYEATIVDAEPEPLPM